MRSLPRAISIACASGAFCAVAMLSACSTLPPPAVRGAVTDAQQQEQQGQISIKLAAFGDQPAKGASFGFFLSVLGDTGTLDLMTPLGSQLAQLRWQADQAWLSDTDGTRAYASIDELTEQVLGTALPVQTLLHWMNGRSDPARPAIPGDEPGVFTQEGWQVDTRELPQRRLLANRPALPQQRGVTVRVILDR